MKTLFLAVLSLCAALPAAAASSSCDAAGVDSILADVAKAKATAPLLDSFEDRSYDVSRARCARGAQQRLMNGKTDGKFLICVSHPTVPGGLEARRPFGAPTLFQSITTDLKALEPDAAQSLCDRINACLYELYDHPKSAAVIKLAAGWDGLSCPGH